MGEKGNKKNNKKWKMKKKKKSRNKNHPKIKMEERLNLKKDWGKK